MRSSIPSPDNWQAAAESRARIAKTTTTPPEILNKKERIARAHNKYALEVVEKATAMANQAAWPLRKYNHENLPTESPDSVAKAKRELQHAAMSCADSG